MGHLPTGGWGVGSLLWWRGESFLGRRVRPCASSGWEPPPTFSLTLSNGSGLSSPCLTSFSPLKQACKRGWGERERVNGPRSLSCSWVRTLPLKTCFKIICSHCAPPPQVQAFPQTPRKNLAGPEGPWRCTSPRRRPTTHWKRLCWCKPTFHSEIKSPS